ncbi:MAG: sel1 repeat family protein [Betaproteobacteria bacterium]|nr:sel1 repeat family protein [Betaproteobacteria bacterium]
MKRILILLALVLAIGTVRADIFQDKVDEALELKDNAEILKMLEAEAFRGNLRAALQLGIMYRTGDRVRKDMAQAIRWLEEAADVNWMRFRFKLGLDEAQYVLGMIRLKGEDTTPDSEEAAEWFEQAAKQGNTRAQTELADLYLNGRGVERDPEQAWIWAQIAADYATGDELKRTESIRDAAAKQLSPEQLAKAKAFVDGWYPRSI